MAKNYILEPTELSWDENAGQYVISSQTSLFDLSLLNENVICEVSDGTLLKYAGEYDGFIFSIHGVVDEYGEAQLPFVVYADDEVSLSYLIEGEPATPTVTVSIYTETEDPEPSGEDESDSDSNDISRNFAFSDHSRNDMDGIADIMDDLLGLSTNSEEESSDDEQPSEDTTPEPGPSEDESK